MNELFEDFILKNDIDIESIYKDLEIYSEKQINRLISNNKLEGTTKEALIPISDIIGYDYEWRGHTNNLADNFSKFFDIGTSYQSRSISMLEYTSENIIEKLYQSFKTEKIRVLELDNGRKIISGNGLHRYTLIRILYLNELQKVKGNKEEEEYLKSKYEIPVELTKVDILKTYCNYLIKLTSILDDITVENVPGNNEYTTVSETGKQIQLNRNGLIEYTKNRIKCLNGEMKKWFIEKITKNYNMYDSFKQFIDNNFYNELVPFMEKNEKKGRGI